MKGKLYIVVLASIASNLFVREGLQPFFIAFMLALSYLIYKNRQNKYLLFLCITTFAYFIFSPLYHPPMVSPTETSLLGKITSIPQQDGNRLSFEMKSLKNVKVQVQYYMKTKKEKEELSLLNYGMTCQFEGEYTPPPSRTNFYMFDYGKYLTTKQIYYLYAPNQISLNNCNERNVGIFDQLQRLRQKGIEKIKEHFPEQSKGIVIALIFGDKGEIDNHTIHAYQSLGIIHLLAVSGLHVGFVSASLFFVFIRVGFTRESSVNLLIVVLPIYGIIAGASPSVVRATAMCIALLLSLKFKCKLSPLDGISIVCLVLLFLNPQYIFHLGFQLSFFISFSLILSQKIISNYKLNRMIQLFVVTSIAQLVSFPIIIYHFYEISPWSILLNMVYIPFISFVILPSSIVILVLFYIFPSGASILLIVHNQMLEVIHSFLLWWNSLSHTTLLLGKPADIIIVLYYIIIGVILYVFEQKKTFKVKSVSISTLCLVVMFHLYGPYLSPYGEVTMLNVGQGDCILLEFPRRKAVYLIDTGGNIKVDREDWKQGKDKFDVGEDILIPFLKAKGIKEIDKLILTHGHVDHVGGAFALLDQVVVKQILYGYGQIESQLEKELLHEFSKRGTEIKFIKEGDRWSLSDHHFYALSPVGSESEPNDRSIVIYSYIGGLYWLFTGDLEKDGELRIVSKYPKIPVDVLKVAHHGSNTSTTNEFLKFISPKIALLSVGKNNSYNHPHPDVINNLKDENIILLRTDEQGAIQYRYRGDKGSFKWTTKEQEQ